MNVPIYRFSIPIDNYYQEEVFYKQVYFSCENCPSRDVVQTTLMEARKKEIQQTGEIYGEETCSQRNGFWTDEYGQCLDALDNLEKDFPFIYGSLTGTNEFVNHPRWGRCPLTVNLIKPFTL